ncbi:MAG: hypothetical protein F6J94_25340 [Moorea sp. SIO1F2]|uniref:Uncharacterized protein n=1 Tax=Moorena bouillonii PNG TaxID=568701 RepID=A0A1U7N4H0_9CYAN|nr:MULTISPECIES: hypothetical protein [Moorena]NEO48659.1 hypothetical protein [Moorena sp. SIO4A3]NEO67403.1 hypothetical protein [Moorena sp. SIO4G2]NET85116.1 hypothetical protein [Moorena sp. SIO1F2]OLT60853.1 hypothetical protein BJP37_19375 [Moorena bouillonii PNG]
MSRNFDHIAYSVSTLVYQYNCYSPNTIEYVLFNQGLLAGLERQAEASDSPVYLEGYEIGQTY